MRVCPCKAETVTGLALKERGQLLALMGVHAQRRQVKMLALWVRRR